MQGVTGGVDTSGISDKESRGERKAKSRQLGCSLGQEEERDREASLVGSNQTQASPPRARGQKPGTALGTAVGTSQPVPGPGCCQQDQGGVG